MTDFVWILPHEKEHALGEGGVSKQYIVPLASMNGLEGDLNNARIWITVRKDKDKCIAVVTLDKLEQFTEGYYSGDFLLSIDLERSFRLHKTIESSDSGLIHSISAYSFGISKVTESIAREFRSIVDQTKQTRLLVPKKSIFVINKTISQQQEARKIAREALFQVVSVFALSEIWSSAQDPKLPPYSYFAYHLLNQNDAIVTPATVDALRHLDPTDLIFSDIQTLQDTQRGVDIHLREIDPESIYARKLIARKDSVDLASAIEKTEAAERVHQEMLRDLAIYLRQSGLNPLESDSIDLMFDQKGEIRMFELKSANNSNVISQSGKAAFQLALYQDALRDSYDQINLAVIIQKIDNDELARHVASAFSRLGISCFFYDHSKQWPHRVDGLLN